jgi:hypothetical protein
VALIISHCVRSVVVALLLVKCMRIGSMIGYGVLLSGAVTTWFLCASR